MARLLVKNNRLAVRNGRLVTTAGGAPCCCGVPFRCECDPRQPIVTNRIITVCGPSGQADVIETLPPHRVETLRATYTFTSEIEERHDYIPTPPPNLPTPLFYLRREGLSVTGTLVYCRTANFTQLLAYQETAFRYRYIEPDQTSSFEWSGQRSFPDGNSNFDPPSPIGFEAGFSMAAPITTGRTNAFDCNIVFERNEGPSPTGSFLRSRDTRTESRSVGGGSRRTEKTFVRFWSYEDNYATIKNITSREVFDMTYTRTLDLCEGGGGGGSGSRPGNCAGCGDASRLTIV